MSKNYDFEIFNNFIGYGSSKAEYIFFGLEEKFDSVYDEFENNLIDKLFSISQNKFKKSSTDYYTLEEQDFDEFYSDPSIRKIFECRANNNYFYKRVLEYYKRHIYDRNLDKRVFNKPKSELVPYNLGGKYTSDLLIGNIYPVPRNTHKNEIIPKIYKESFGEKVLSNYSNSKEMLRRWEIIHSFLKDINNDILNRKVIIFGESDEAYKALKDISVFGVKDKENTFYFDNNIKNNNFRNKYYYTENPYYKIAICNHPTSGLSYDNVKIIFNRFSN